MKKSSAKFLLTSAALGLIAVLAPGADASSPASDNAGPGADHILFFNNMVIVPEPSTLALVSLGGIAAALWRFRRKL
jgi:hypothetical protein